MNTISNSGSWNDIRASLNENFSLIEVRFKKVENSVYKHKGFYNSVSALLSAQEGASIGSYALVLSGQNSEGLSLYKLYNKTQDGWEAQVDTEMTASEALDSIYDYLNIPLASQSEAGLMPPEYVSLLNNIEANTLITDAGVFTNFSDLSDRLRSVDLLKRESQIFLSKISSTLSVICFSVVRNNNSGWKQYIFRGDEILFRILSKSSSNNLYSFDSSRHTSDNWIPFCADNLTTSDPDVLLSAKQGKILADEISSQQWLLSYLNDRSKAEIPIYSGEIESASIIDNSVTQYSGVYFIKSEGAFAAKKGSEYYSNWLAYNSFQKKDVYNQGGKAISNRLYYLSALGGGYLHYFDGFSFKALANNSALASLQEKVELHSESLTDHEVRVKLLEGKSVLDLGEVSSAAAGYNLAGSKEIAENLNVHFIVFKVPSISHTQIIYQQHNGYTCTQYMIFEGRTKKSYTRGITMGGNYSVGGWNQVHLYTDMRVEDGKLVGYTNGLDGDTARTEICDI